MKYTYKFSAGIIVCSLLSLLILTGFTENKTSELNSEKNIIETVTDFDNNVYKAIKIGSQIWMAENLKVTHYRDGTPIPNIYNNDKWPAAKSGAYCMVKNDSIGYKNTYGVLYNFFAVNNKHKLSPEGWHIPSKVECMKLINYLGGIESAGEKIKNNISKLWKSSKSFAQDESGFSALPAGGRGRLGSPGDVGFYATWWSSTSYDSMYAWHWGVFPDKPGIRSNPGHKASGFSVRCIKDYK